MKIKANFIICISIAIFFSCNNQNPVKNKIAESLLCPQTINIKEALEKSEPIKLSEIADSIKYIVLSKDKKVLTKRFLYLEMFDNDIFMQLGSLIYRFDRNGTFLNTIGKIGRGPEEYLNGSMFSINPISETVYVYRNFSHDFVSYNFSGIFLHNLPFRSNHDIGSFICMSDSTFFIYPVYWGVVPKDMFLCGTFNYHGRKIHTIKHPAQTIPADFNASKFMTGGPWPIYTYFNDELIAMCDFDTVYKIAESSIYSAFILNWGNMPRSKTFEEKYYINSRPINSIANPTKLFETSLKAFILINDHINYHLIEFDKRNLNSKSMILSDKDNLGFINDIDGGSNFYPEWTNRKGSIWIKSIEQLN